jgi:hypothetical protein
VPFHLGPGFVVDIAGFLPRCTTDPRAVDEHVYGDILSRRVLCGDIGERRRGDEIDIDRMIWRGNPRLSPHGRRPRPRQGAKRKMGRRPELTDHQKREGIKRRDHGEETPAEIGRSYNVSGWTIARLAL